MRHRIGLAEPNPLPRLVAESELLVTGLRQNHHHQPAPDVFLSNRDPPTGSRTNRPSAGRSSLSVRTSSLPVTMSPIRQVRYSRSRPSPVMSVLFRHPIKYPSSKMDLCNWLIINALSDLNETWIACSAASHQVRVWSSALAHADTWRISFGFGMVSSK